MGGVPHESIKGAGDLNLHPFFLLVQTDWTAVSSDEPWRLNNRLLREDPTEIHHKHM